MTGDESGAEGPEGNAIGRDPTVHLPGTPQNPTEACNSETLGKVGVRCGVGGTNQT